jgi:hypothetical protein
VPRERSTEWSVLFRIGAQLRFGFVTLTADPEDKESGQHQPKEAARHTDLKVTGSQDGRSGLGIGNA